jgi:hypothetical protein
MSTPINNLGIKPPDDWRLVTAAKYIKICEDLDAGVLSFDKLNVFQITNLYVFSSYLYYHKDEPILDDKTYDALCLYMLDTLDEIQNSKVWYKHLFDKEALTSGTGFHLKYPDIHLKMCEALLMLLTNAKRKEEYMKQHVSEKI